MTTRWVAGEAGGTRKKDGTVQWHRVDPAGIDDTPKIRRLRSYLPNDLSFHKTLCGKHYGADFVESDGPPQGTSFLPCADCG